MNTRYHHTDYSLINQSEHQFYSWDEMLSVCGGIMNNVFNDSADLVSARRDSRVLGSGGPDGSDGRTKPIDLRSVIGRFPLFHGVASHCAALSPPAPRGGSVEWWEI